MKRSQPAKPRRGHRLLAPIVGFLAALVGASGHAASFPDFPLQTGTGSVPPNILFIMDDSGSMGSVFMGARDTNLRALEDNPEERSYVNNTLYYNPEVDYQPWMGWDRTRLSGGAVYNAAFAHFDLAEGEINLADSGSYYDSPSNQTGSSTTRVKGGDQTFWVPKEDRINPGTAKGNYYRYRIRAGDLGIERCDGSNLNICEDRTPTGRTEEAERNNYATWFSYHRTRMKAAKAGASEAFSQLGINFRVGYDSLWRLRKGIRETVPGSGPVFPIPVEAGAGLFSGENRAEWYEWLHGARNYRTTPLRNSLVRAGRDY